MNPRSRQTRSPYGIVKHWGQVVRLPVEGEPPPSPPAKRRKWRCELAVFLNGSNQGLWFFPIPITGASAYRFRWLDGNKAVGWRTCHVVIRKDKTECSCFVGCTSITGICDHIRVLESLFLLPE